MIKKIERADGRLAHQLRPLTVSYNSFGYADGSVLFSLGNTKVLCAITLQAGVPAFLKGKKTGWLTAEYSLMPTSTKTRVQRDSSQKYNGRSIEIARLIGRSLRTVINLHKLGERTIIVDCDVLQADGGTRTACITAAFLALRQAVKKWVTDGVLVESILIDELAAISIGLKNQEVLLDIDYAEDSLIDADYNFVLNRSGSIVEVQGTTESKAIPWPLFYTMCSVAAEGIKKLFEQLDEISPNSIEDDVKNDQSEQPVFLSHTSKGMLNALTKYHLKLSD